MQFELWSLGNDQAKLFEVGITEYIKRINRYHHGKIVYLDNSKISKLALPKEQMLLKESELILQKLQDRDLLICLDEHGKSYTSVEFAHQLQQWMNRSAQRVIFLIGGSYGIAPLIKQRAHASIALSALTFPHQLVRLIFVEQLYRAFTILNNEKYHHE